MKQLLLIFATSFLFVACNQSTSNQLNEQEKQSIKAEVQKICNSLINLASNLDLKLFDFYDSSSSIVASGQIFNYVDRRKAFSEGTANAKSQKFTKKFEDIWVLDKDNVYWLWHGDVLETFKNDSSFTSKDVSVTSLFRRVGNNWKVMYSHESVPCP
ncbi:MAG: nuclear transport factor 2 family protein [Chitinophagaceae bacterium]